MKRRTHWPHPPVRRRTAPPASGQSAYTSEIWDWAPGAGGRLVYTGPVLRDTRLPADIGSRIPTLGDALAACQAIVFAYLFGSAAADRLEPLSDVDVAVYVEDGVDPAAVRLEAIGLVSRHLGTDAVDLVVLNSAPTALAGRVLLGRRVILDRRPFSRHRYESRTIREFLDFRDFERRLLARRFDRGGPRPAPPEAR